MQQEKEAAHEFGKQARQQAAQEARQRSDLNLLEEQRRRQNMVSRINFRYSRLHELGVPQLVVNNKELQWTADDNAATQAEEQTARAQAEQVARQQRRQEDAKRAAERGARANMLLQAEQSRQRMEQALQEMESNEVQQRKHDIAAGRLNAAPLLRKWRQQKRQAQARRAFEHDFLHSPAKAVQAGFPSFVTKERAEQQQTEDATPTLSEAAAAERALQLVAELQRLRRAEEPEDVGAAAATALPAASSSRLIEEPLESLVLGSSVASSDLEELAAFDAEVERVLQQDLALTQQSLHQAAAAIPASTAAAHPSLAAPWRQPVQQATSLDQPAGPEIPGAAAAAADAQQPATTNQAGAVLEELIDKILAPEYPANILGEQHDPLPSADSPRMPPGRSAHRAAAPTAAASSRGPRSSQLAKLLEAIQVDLKALDLAELLGGGRSTTSSSIGSLPSPLLQGPAEGQDAQQPLADLPDLAAWLASSSDSSVAGWADLAVPLPPQQQRLRAQGRSGAPTTTANIVGMQGLQQQQQQPSGALPSGGPSSSASALRGPLAAAATMTAAQRTSVMGDSAAGQPLLGEVVGEGPTVLSALAPISEEATASDTLSSVTSSQVLLSQVQGGSLTSATSTQQQLPGQRQAQQAARGSSSTSMSRQGFGSGHGMLLMPGGTPSAADSGDSFSDVVSDLLGHIDETFAALSGAAASISSRGPHTSQLGTATQSAGSMGPQGRQSLQDARRQLQIHTEAARPERAADSMQPTIGLPGTSVQKERQQQQPPQLPSMVSKSSSPDRDSSSSGDGTTISSSSSFTFTKSTEQLLQQVRLGGLASAGSTERAGAGMEEQQQRLAGAASSSSSRGGAGAGTSWQAGLESLRSSADTDVLLASLAAGSFGLAGSFSMAESSSLSAGNSEAALATSAAQAGASSVLQDSHPGHQLHFQQPAPLAHPQVGAESSSGAADVPARQLLSPDDSVGSLSMMSSGSSSRHDAAADSGCSSYRPLSRETRSAAVEGTVVVAAGSAAAGSGSLQRVSRRQIQQPLPPAGTLSALLAEILAEDSEE
eukprot:gene7879-8075_t